MTQKSGRPEKAKTSCCSAPVACSCDEPTPLEKARIAACLEGSISTVAGEIPRVGTRLKAKDRRDAWKVRWGFGRGSYRIPAGLYAAGNPDSGSPVLVSANYKLSFDALRRELDGLNAWILVLDTMGINVWCAAGKGTFGTAEVVRRVAETGLARIVSHRKIVLPQLGAPGVAAHEVQKKTKFRVVYGPVRAADLPEFLERGMAATPTMRRIMFGFRERLKLIPVEIIQALPILAGVLAFQVLLSLVTTGRISLPDLIGLAGAVLAGCGLVPALLPWIPGRAFAFKGWLAGVLWVGALLAFSVLVQGQPIRWMSLAQSLLLYPAISGYVAMNFTGSSTFTSLSGVVKEMRLAVPLIIVSVALFLMLRVAAIFIRT